MKKPSVGDDIVVIEEFNDPVPLHLLEGRTHWGKVVKVGRKYFWAAYGGPSKYSGSGYRNETQFELDTWFSTNDIGYKARCFTPVDAIDYQQRQEMLKIASDFGLMFNRVALEKLTTSQLQAIAAILGESG